MVPRPPLDAAGLRAALRERLGDAAHRWMDRVLDLPPIDASSTEARALLSRGERPASCLLLPAVTDHALRHGLYRDDAR